MSRYASQLIEPMYKSAQNKCLKQKWLHLKCSHENIIFWVENIIELPLRRLKRLQRAAHRAAAKAVLPAH